ncbi:C6 finger domain-containing protein [Neofusicoccum parvum]|uniref:C6 finger domain-containing protein n=1 Tax=Neofusicoccum parvum TaxID=310453 RepID=A0ACB5RT00_9PEZI|nr:C6 finger domain-containing protein [Neofusicoccum parvum]
MAAGAAGLYAHPNGNMSPPEASSAVDPHLSLHSGQTLEQELSAQLRGAAEAPMGPAQNHPPQHGLPIPHVGQVHTPVQQPSTPQQMAQNAMSMAQDPHYSQQDSNQRKSRQPMKRGPSKGYYRIIQDVYPILPFDLRNLKGPGATGSLFKPAGIILAQSFLLLAIEADTHGPSRSQGGLSPDLSAGSLKNMCIAAAARIASDLRFDALIFRQRGQEISPDSDESLSRRIFWILVIVDQLHAAATSSRPTLSAERSHLTGDDETLFGPVTFALARLCKVLSALPDYHKTLADAPPANNDVMALFDPTNVLLKWTKTSFLGRLETFSESLPADPHPLILLAYFHVHLLIVRFTPWSEPGEILHDATAIVTHLQRHSACLTSPYHHFAAIAALTLGELAEKDDIREEALRLLGELENVLTRNKIEGDVGWDASIRDYVSKKRSSINESNGGSSTMLEHLAEAAVGERRDSASKPSENRPGSSGNQDPPKDDLSNAAAAAAAAATAAAALNQSLHFNPASLIRDGYLTVLAQVLIQQQQQH